MTEKHSSTGDEKLNAAVALLRSQDILTQNEGVEAAVQLGPMAVPALLLLLDEEAINSFQIMYALAMIGNPVAAPAFKAKLHDKDERVRAYAAVGLARINDPHAMTSCLQTIDDAADELHNDITPSVQALGEMGLRPVSSLLDLLVNKDEMTRLHAQRALELILNRRHGFIPGKGFPSEEAERAALSEWHVTGDYDYSGHPDARAISVAKWRQWLKRVQS